MEENIDEIRLKDVILKIVYFKNLLKRNIVVILAVTFLFGVLGVVYSIFKTESFINPTSSEASLNAVFQLVESIT